MAAVGQMSTLRRLAYPGVPAAGESLTSWLDRAAADHLLTRRRLLMSCGLITTADRFPLWFGIDLTAGEKSGLTTATGVIDFDPMLLGCSPAASFSGTDRTRYATAARWSAAQWVRPYASWVCPHCLDEDGYWRRNWQLPWLPVCLRHRCYLVGECPQCLKPPARRISGVPRLTVCQRHPKKRSRGGQRTLAGGRKPARRRRRRRGSVCGADLTAAPTQPVRDQTLIDLCTCIEKALDGGDAVFGGFADLRAVTVLALQLAGTHMIDGADECVRAVFDAHTRERDADTTRKGENSDGAYRSYRQTPTSPELMAAALRAGAPLVLPGDERTALSTFAEAADVPPIRWTHVRKFWTPPKRLAPHLDMALLRHRRGAGWYSDGRSSHKTGESENSLGAGAVPQLLWPDPTAWVLANVPQMGQGWRRTAPRVLAGMLARRCEPQLSSWEQTCEALDTPGGASGTRQRVAAMREAGTLERAEECLRTIERRLAGRTDRIDYQARRTTLAQFDVDEATWEALRRAAGVPSTVRTRAWRPRVGAWIWCLLTGGDFHFAPGLGLAGMEPQARRVATNAYVIYFCGNSLPGIEPLLRDYARDVLAGHGLGGPLEMTWDPGEFTS